MVKLKKSLAVFLTVILSVIAFSSVSGASVSEEECNEPQYFTSVVLPSCTEQGYTLHVCRVCGYSYRDTYVASLGGHDFGEWYTVSEATCTSSGLLRRDCARIGCTGSETKTIPVVPHTDADENGLCDVCGAQVEVKQKEISPYDWLVKFFEFLRNWFSNIFG